MYLNVLMDMQPNSICINSKLLFGCFKMRVAFLIHWICKRTMLYTYINDLGYQGILENPYHSPPPSPPQMYNSLKALLCAALITEP